jgi:hypothetical protein
MVKLIVWSKLKFQSLYLVLIIEPSDSISNLSLTRWYLLEDWLLSLMSTLVMGFGPQD